MAVDVDAEALQVGIVNSVDAHAAADRGDAIGNCLAPLDIVQSPTLFDTHDEIRTGVAVECLLDGNAIARHGVDFEGAAELVCARRIIVLVAALSTQMAVGASGATSAAIGALGNREGVAVDSATLALLSVEFRVVFDPVTILDRAAGKRNGGGRDGHKESLDKHYDGESEKFENCSVSREYGCYLIDAALLYTGLYIPSEAAVPYASARPPLVGNRVATVVENMGAVSRHCPARSAESSLGIAGSGGKFSGHQPGRSVT